MFCACVYVCIICKEHCKKGLIFKKHLKVGFINRARDRESKHDGKKLEPAGLLLVFFLLLLYFPVLDVCVCVYVCL